MSQDNSEDREQSICHLVSVRFNITIRILTVQLYSSLKSAVFLQNKEDEINALKNVLLMFRDIVPFMVKCKSASIQVSVDSKTKSCSGHLYPLKLQPETTSPRTLSILFSKSGWRMHSSFVIISFLSLACSWQKRASFLLESVLSQSFSASSECRMFTS